MGANVLKSPNLEDSMSLLFEYINPDIVTKGD